MLQYTKIKEIIGEIETDNYPTFIQAIISKELNTDDLDIIETVYAEFISNDDAKGLIGLCDIMKQYVR